MSARPPEFVPSPSPPPIGAHPRIESGDQLAVWAMGAGFTGLLTSPLAGGLLLGPLGLVLAAVAQSRPKTGRPRVLVAVCLSAAALLISVYVAAGGSQQMFSDPLREWEGVRAPDFTLTTLDGSTVRLGELRGKRVFVDVWATWCPPCRAMQPELERLAERWADKGVVVVGLSADDTERDLAEYARPKTIGYPVGWMGPGFPAPYSEVRGLPTLFVIDRDGVIVAVEVGYHSFNELTQLATLPDYAGQPKEAPVRAKAAQR